MTSQKLSVCTHYNSQRKRDILMKLGVRIFWVKSKVELVDGFCGQHLEVVGWV